MFKGVHGQNETKVLLQELVIKPFKAKKYSPSLVSILLIGPPGCGKSYLGKALAEELKGIGNYYHLHSSTILGYSKEHGGQIRCLQAEIKKVLDTPPSVFLLDDLASEDEMFPCAFKCRFGKELTEELVKLKESANGSIALIGATQSPWSMDKHLWALFDIKIYLRKLKFGDRLAILKQSLGQSIDLEAGTIEELAKYTEQYTGADLKVLSNSICRIPMTVLLNATHFKVRYKNGKRVFIACVPSDEDAMNWTDFTGDQEPIFEVVTKDAAMEVLHIQSLEVDVWQKYNIYEDSRPTLQYLFLNRS